ncbi:hypothetical protein [Sediminibacillus massiliensis]|uniref:hypothetical protein n=1 Tax=Sediminibacillus massiliensis TaxID=1926277 RepID=UPI0009888922|nr:hypothetical protein [Sediminibacillus massiliensis]
MSDSKRYVASRRQVIELALAEKINVLIGSYKVNWIGREPESHKEKRLKTLIDQGNVYAEPYNGGLYIFD